MICELAVRSAFLAVTAFSLASHAQVAANGTSPEPPLYVVDASQAGSEAMAKMRTDTTHIAAEKSGWVITVDPGPASYPGIDISGAKPWNLSKYGTLEAAVTNTSSKRIAISLGISGKDWNKNSAEIVRLDPGKSGTVKVYLGFNFGKPVLGFPQDALTQISVITTKTDTPVSFKVMKIVAGGAAGDKPPADASHGPKIAAPTSAILGGAAPAFEAKQLGATGGAKPVIVDGGKAVEITFGGGKVEGAVLRPAVGTWNLRYALQVHVHLKNTGTTAITPAVRVDSRGGPTAAYSTPTPIAPGAEADVVVPFSAATPWVGDIDPLQTTLESKKIWNGVPGTGTDFASVYTTSVSILSDPKNPAGKLLVTSVVADMPRPTVLPPDAGKKPPVPGDWAMSFDEEFDGPALDTKKWVPYTKTGLFNQPNYHLSKDQIQFKDGKGILRIEKKTGKMNDDPKGLESGYAGAYLSTFGKWRQRYGYYEIRMKMPDSPASYICWWLMPDLGSAKGPFNIRANTKEGGMEFDISEHLAIWGPYRTDFGDHWDGYQKYHKSNGNFSNYAVPDKDGFITYGMLWVPGKVTYYTNGKVVGSWESARVGTQPEFMILNNVPGGWEKEDMDDTKLPADYVVDYVRVWQRKDLASAVDGFRDDSTDDSQ